MLKYYLWSKVAHVCDVIRQTIRYQIAIKESLEAHTKAGTLNKGLEEIARGAISQNNQTLLQATEDLNRDVFLLEEVDSQRNDGRLDVWLKENSDIYPTDPLIIDIGEYNEH